METLPSGPNQPPQYLPTGLLLAVILRVDIPPASSWSLSAPSTEATTGSPSPRASAWCRSQQRRECHAGNALVHSRAGPGDLRHAGRPAPGLQPESGDSVHPTQARRRQPGAYTQGPDPKPSRAPDPTRRRGKHFVPRQRPGPFAFCALLGESFASPERAPRYRSAQTPCP
jgi:hypothetical protein